MNTLANVESLGGEWAVVLVARILVFLIGFALCSITSYLITKALKGPIVVAGPPPAEPAAEAHVVSLDKPEAERGHHCHQ